MSSSVTIHFRGDEYDLLIDGDGNYTVYTLGGVQVDDLTQKEEESLSEYVYEYRSYMSEP